MRSRFVPAFALLALAGSAAAGPIDVIYSKIPGHPTAAVPGAINLDGNPAATDFRALEDLILSPDGTRWFLKGRTQLGSEMENITFMGTGLVGTRFIQEGELIPGGGADERYEFFGSGLGRFDSTNRFAFSARARTMRTGSTSAPNGQRVLYFDGTTTTLRYKEGDLISGLADTGATGDERVGNSVGSIHPRDDGVLGAQDSTILGISTTRRPATMYDLAGFKQSNVSTFLGIDGVTTETWATISANTFYTTPDNAHWMMQGRAVSQVSTAAVLVRDNAAVLQTGTMIPSSTVVVDSIFDYSLLSNGVWYARGDDAASNDWATKNGVVVAQTGGNVIGPGETWGAVFNSITGNRLGEWVLAGTTSEPDLGRNEVLVFNGTQILAREGDRVDLNGNGMPDDDAFIGRGNNTLTAFEAGDVAISDGRTVYFIANLRNAAGVDLNSSPTFGSPQAFLRLQVTVVCAADFNGVGGLTVQDIFDFLAAYFANLPAADFNGVGGVTVQDIFDFLGAYFMGCP